MLCDIGGPTQREDLAVLIGDRVMLEKWACPTSPGSTFFRLAMFLDLPHGIAFAFPLVFI
jgi:hypothetical protein